MKNVQEWINDKPVLLALTSLEWVYLAPEIYKYLCFLSDDKLKEKLPIPPIAKWIEMYENPLMISMVAEMIMNMNDFSTKFMGMLERVRLPNNEEMEIKEQALMTPNELKAHEKNNDIQDNYWLKINKIRLDDMKGELSGVDGGMKEKSRELLNLPIFIYAARVLMPSILLYQKNPQTLFKEAKNGKLDSLAKLLVIDKEILRDETIFGFFRNAAQQDKGLDFNMLTKVFRQTPADLFSLKKVKVAIARFIVDFSKMMGHRFTINDIRDLYDKMEKDRKGDDAAIDEDELYDSQDSFYKAVMRHPGYDFLFPQNVSDKIF